MYPALSPEVFEQLRGHGCLARVPVPAAVNGSSSQVGSQQTLELIGPVPLPVDSAGREHIARWYVGALSAGQSAAPVESVSALVFGAVGVEAGPPLVRIHSTCLTGDVLGSLRCDCGPQLRAAMAQMATSPAGGVMIYMPTHEGRGIGLWNKAAAYLLQDTGLDTYEANRALGFEDDLRDFRHAAAVIRHLLGERPFRLLTNNPEKVKQLQALGLHGVLQQGHVVPSHPRNRRYLAAKRTHGHTLPAFACGCSCC